MNLGYILFVVNGAFHLPRGIYFLLYSPPTSASVGGGLTLPGRFAFKVVGAAFVQMGALTLCLRNRANMNIGKLAGFLIGIYHTLDASACLWALSKAEGRRGLLRNPSSFSRSGRQFAMALALHGGLAAGFLGFTKTHRGTLAQYFHF
eukprot:CAMPEP_0167776892 /NCGR_PEP_ID=MMETSP0111_2-20121227/3380_1 /TAXON_ID=91324 /ORGANISM="Lotharella globosa, Strain CCCM811" /LENGTH=147 /DNA_ID=CAMNT_0007666995 /DNA_START=30 /DNA_END=473 /DNA_ORIENTATION=+